MYKEQDVPHYQIMEAFLQQYRVEMSQADEHLLSIAREMEDKPDVATEYPSIAEFAEKYGKGKLELDSIILAIASSVARACVEAYRILQP